MLYLAEVIQKKGGIIGGNKSELKLLACQRGEQNWAAVSSEEVVQAEEASRYSPGTLLLVDLTGTKQVQRIQEAGRPLVSILQNFSKQQEKFKTREEEIEQWKESLTYQSQELSRREMELAALQEQLQQGEVEFEQMEQQRQEFESTREEVLRQQEELDRQRQEMEGAWDQLRGQQEQLEERKVELLGAAVLDEEKAQIIHQLLEQVSSSTASPDEIHAQLVQLHEGLTQQQDTLTPHWQSFEQEQQSVQQMQAEVQQHLERVEQQWQVWQQAQASVEQAKAEVADQEARLQTQQEVATLLSTQIQQSQEMQQQLSQAASGGAIAEGVQIDLDALENMPLEELQAATDNLQGEFDQSSQFVNGQEEELKHKQKELDELREKIQQASEFDRMTLETELTDELDAYQFLDDTLVGQRRSLTEKEVILLHHRTVLARRTGQPDPRMKDAGIDLTPVFAQFESQRQQQTEHLQQVEAQIEAIRATLQQAQTHLESQTHEVNAQRETLQQLDAALRTQIQSASIAAGRIAVYQEMLQSIQDSATALHQPYEALTTLLTQYQEGQYQQQQSIEQLKQVVGELAQQPELVPA